MKKTKYVILGASIIFAILLSSSAAAIINANIKIDELPRVAELTLGPSFEVNVNVERGREGFTITVILKNLQRNPATINLIQSPYYGFKVFNQNRREVYLYQVFRIEDTHIQLRGNSEIELFNARWNGVDNSGNRLPSGIYHIIGFLSAYSDRAGIYRGIQSKPYSIRIGTEETVDSIEVITNKNEYKMGEIITFTIKNVGIRPITFLGPGFEIYNDERELVYSERYRGVFDLRPGEESEESWSWDQKNTNGRQVSIGEYTLIGYSTDDKYSDEIRFEIKRKIPSLTDSKFAIKLDSIKLSVNPLKTANQINTAVTLPLTNQLSITTPSSTITNQKQTVDVYNDLQKQQIIQDIKSILKIS